MFLHESTERYFAVAGDGLEEVVATELTRLGAREVAATRRGVHFVADAQTVAHIVVSARCAGRLLAPIESFACHSDRYLYRRVAELPWEELMDVEETLAVSCTLSNSHLRHTQYAAQVTKDAICDRFRERVQKRPSVDRHDADLRIHVHVQANKATVSIDLGAGARHRRGYRTEAGAAPLQETVAAAVLELAGYDGSRPLLDPMCGSGTFLAEAVLRARGSAVVRDVRGLGAARLPGIGPRRVADAFASVEAAAADAPDATILGCDLDAEVLGIARENLERVPGGEEVRVSRRDFRTHDGIRDGLVVCNPPYGVRLGSRQEAFDTIRALGDFLKHRCHGSVAWLVLGDAELLKHVGLRTSRRIAVRIGGLDGRLARYELF